MSDLFSGVLGTATVLNPYSQTYVNFTNVLAWNAGAATVPSMFVGKKGDYRKARVTGFRLTVRAVNNETFPCEVSVTPLNFLPPNTLLQNQANVKNPLTKRRTLSAKGGQDKCSVSVSGTTQSIGGFSYRFGVEDPLVFNTDGSSAPTDNVYAAINVDTAGLAAAAGVTLWLAMHWTMDFFERQTN